MVTGTEGTDLWPSQSDNSQDSMKPTWPHVTRQKPLLPWSSHLLHYINLTPALKALKSYPFLPTGLNTQEQSKTSDTQRNQCTDSNKSNWYWLPELWMNCLLGEKNVTLVPGTFLHFHPSLAALGKIISSFAFALFSWGKKHPKSRALSHTVCKKVLKITHSVNKDPVFSM